MKVTPYMMGKPFMVSLVKLYLPADIADPWSINKERAVTDAMDIEWWVRGSTEWMREQLKAYCADPLCVSLTAAAEIVWDAMASTKDPAARNRLDNWWYRLATLRDDRRSVVTDEWINR